ncbi:MAG: hypothetical protein IKJ69_04160 [Clostridia bacterium]|nr:hypothetical protein [Clostridia bacterium]
MGKISDLEVQRIFVEKYLPYRQHIDLEFVGPLDTGACMSQIYCVKKKSDNTEYILKVVTNMDESTPSLLVTVAYNEIVSLYQYYYTNLVPEIVDVFEYCNGNDFVFFIFMKKYKTLGEIELKTEKDIFDITVDVLHALKYMHEVSDFKDTHNNIIKTTNLSFPTNYFVRKNYHINYYSPRLSIHRDIKPANILVRINEQNQKEFLLADFGAVTFVNPTPGNPDENRPCTGLCTKDYADPEFTCKVKNSMPLSPEDVNSDIYSLGLSIKRLLTAAHTATVYNLRYKEKFADEIGASDFINELTRPNHVSAEFWNIIDRMSLKTCVRYKNVDEVLADLETCYENGCISDKEFPQEIIERNKLAELISENKFSELRKYAEELYNIDPNNSAYLRLYVHSHVKFFKEKTCAEFIEALDRTTEPMSRCLAAMIRIRNYKSNEQVVLKELAEEGCIPAMYLYAREEKKKLFDHNNKLINNFELQQEITNYYEILFDVRFVPALRSYLKILEDPAHSPCIVLNLEEKKDRIEEIKSYLAENNISNVVAFFDYMY